MVKPLPHPKLNRRRVVAVSVAAFTVFGVIAAIVLIGAQGLSRSDKAFLLGAMVAGSLLIGFIPHLYEVAVTVVSRVRHYDDAVVRADKLGGAVLQTIDHLRRLNTDVPIQEIRDVNGTVHLIFPYGTHSGLGQGMVIEVVRETGGERLGSVSIVDAAVDWSLAKPTDRTVSEFWDGLEDRMRSDFSPPAAVVGRIFRITGSTVADLLHHLEEDSGVTQ